jgi:hypothetical protein
VTAVRDQVTDLISGPDTRGTVVSTSAYERPVAPDLAKKGVRVGIRVSLATVIASDAGFKYMEVRKVGVFVTNLGGEISKCLLDGLFFLHPHICNERL